MKPAEPPQFRTEVLLAGSPAGENGSRRTVIGISIGLHVVLLALVFVMPEPEPRRTKPKPIDVVFFSPRPEPAAVAPPPPKIEPPKPARPKNEPPRKIEPPVPKAAPNPVRTPTPPVETARVDPRPPTRPGPRPAAPKPVAPAPKVRTDVFGGEPEAPARKAPKKAVRTDAFAETKPAPERSASPTHRGSARVGGFEVEPTRAPAVEDRRAITPATSFEEPAAPVLQGKPSRGRATVELASFGDAVHEEREAPRTQTAAVVRQSGFGDGVAAKQPRKKKSPPTENPDTPVEILSKPAPVYTEEARSLRVEGEVVLKVVFVSSGELKVLDVVSRLGHGLDEAAVEAAKKIRFTPARRAGHPVDHTAVLRIVFQLV